MCKETHTHTHTQSYFIKAAAETVSNPRKKETALCNLNEKEEKKARGGKKYNHLNF